MSQKNRVIIRNTTSLHGTRAAFSPFRDQLGILAANAGDAVVMRKEPEKNFCRYLQDIGILPEETIFITRQSEENNNRFDILFQDRHIAESIRPLAGTHELFPFYVTEHELGFSKRVGMPLCYDPNVESLRYNRKSIFRNLLKTLGLPLPLGFEFVEREELAATVEAVFHAKDGGIREWVVIKHDTGSAGSTNVLIHRDIFTSLTTEEKNEFIEHKLARAGFVEDRGPFVVEEWHPSIAASPSIFFECLGPGNYRRIFLHDQVLGGFARHYNGCASIHNGIDESVWTEVDALARRLVDYLSKQGYTGFAGFDAIVSKGQVYLVDANIRVVSGYFPMAALNKLIGERHVAYFNSNINIPFEPLTNTEKLLNFLRPVLYSDRRKEGVVILATFPYHSGNWYRHVDYLCIGQNNRSARETASVLTGILSSLW